MLNNFTSKIIGISLLSLLLILVAASTNPVNQETDLFEIIATHEIKDGKIIFDFKLINHYDTEQVLQFGSGQQYEITITNKDGEEIHRYSDGKAFTLALVYQTLEPSESLSWQEKWNLTNKDGEQVESGKYTAEIKVLTNFVDSDTVIPEDQLTAILEINLEP